MEFGFWESRWRLRATTSRSTSLHLRFRLSLSLASLSLIFSLSLSLEARQAMVAGTLPEESEAQRTTPPWAERSGTCAFRLHCTSSVEERERELTAETRGERAWGLHSK